MRCVVSVIAAVGSLVCARAALAAVTMSVSPAAPAVNPPDIAQLVGNADIGGDQGHIWNNRPVQGQSFLTGSNPGGYLLNAVTFQNLNNTTTSGVFAIRVGTIDGTSITTVRRETAANTVSYAPGNFITAALNTPVWLMPNQLYGVDWGSSGAGFVTRNNWDSDGNLYSDGAAYSSGSGSVPGATLTFHAADRVFHLALADSSAYVWTGSNDASWQNAANWTPGVPGVNDFVAFPTAVPATGATISVPTGAAAGQLLFNNSYALTGGSLQFDELNVIDGQTVTLATQLRRGTAAGGRLFGYTPNGATVILNADNSGYDGTYMDVGNLRVRLLDGNAVPGPYFNVFGGGTVELAGGIAVPADKMIYLSAETATLTSPSGNNVWNGDVRLHLASGNRTIDVAAGSSLTLSQGISRSDTLTHTLRKTGGGTLVLGGGSTYTGGTVVAAGTLAVNAIDDAGTSGIGPAVGGANYLALANGTLRYTGTGPSTTTRRLWIDQGTGTFDITEPTGSLTWNAGTDSTRNRNIIKDGPGTLNLNAVISGSAQVRVNQGTLILGAANTYTGGTAMEGGTLVVHAIDDSGTSNIGPSNGGANYLGLTNATLRYTGTGASTTTRRLWIDRGTGTFDITEPTGSLTWNAGTDSTRNRNVVKTGPGTLNLNAVISGGAALTVNAGLMVLGEANTYTGGTSVSGGTLRAMGTGKLYMGGGGGNYNVTVSSGAILEIDDFRWDGSLGKLWYPSGNIVLNNGTLRYLGTTATGNNGRGLTIGAGGATLEAATAGQKWTLSHHADSPSLISTAGGLLTLTGTGDGEVGKVIPGSGGLVKLGGGTWTLTAANTYSGNTVVSGGTLDLTSGGLYTDAYRTSMVTVDNGATLRVGSWAYGATSNGLGNLRHESASHVFNNGTLEHVGGTETAGRGMMLQAGGGRVHVGNADTTLTISGAGGGIQGIGNLIKTGPGTLELTGANSYSGTTTIDAGTLLVRSALRNTSTITVNADATLETGATNIFVANHGTAMPDSRVITVDGGTWLMDASMDSRFGNVTLRNGATWTSNRSLSAWDALLANTTAGAATVLVSNAGGNTSPSTMNGTGGIHMQGVQNFNVANVTGTPDADLIVSMILDGPGNAGGAGGIHKLGDGTMLLTAANTYNGGTTVSAGTLLGNNTTGSGTGSGAVLVHQSGTLGGTGSIAGTVTIGAGGMHAPGASVGSQTVGGETWLPGGAFQFEINDADGVPGGPAGWDLLNVSGTLDLAVLTEQDPFLIDIVSLSGAAPGNIANFVATEPAVWPFLQYGNLAGEFHANLFELRWDDFTNDLGQGRFQVLQLDGNWLAIGYVPEPGTWLLLLSALACGLLVRRRQPGAVPRGCLPG